MKMSHASFYRIVLFSVTSFALIWAAGFIGFNVHIKSMHKQPHPPTQAIIVLTGGPDRINTGLDLLNEKMAEHLFISGVNTQVSVEQLISLWREDVPAPPCCIVLGHMAQNTFENAAEARDWMRVNEIKSAWILTANYHMPRAWMEFQSMLPDMDLHPYPVISTDIENSLPLYLYVALREYNKTLLTWLRLQFRNEAL